MYIVSYRLDSVLNRWVSTYSTSYLRIFPSTLESCLFGGPQESNFSHSNVLQNIDSMRSHWLRYCYWRSEVLIKMLKLFGRVRVISMSSKLRFHIHYINVPKMLFPGSPAAPSTTRRWRNNRELSGIYSHRHPVRKTIMRWLIWNTSRQRRYCDKCRV